ncbi:hypothetical protein MLD38_002123 [Melastoma candidum]|uniref:Uncharacterized protein n=1 Tax=Melastoma candidum TaxID=119954 RepID=A0ACB9SIQ9_9MYRT|nr:hypothetical protein MLD38_002123 [Melastoma candidum]
MDRRSWPWKRKSSDKAAAGKAAAEKAAAILDNVGDLEAAPKDQDTYKKPNYVQISVESYTHMTGLEEQLRFYEEQVEKLEEYIKELDEQLSAAKLEITAKEDVAKQHAKVAEDAVLGWEKAEAEAIALQSHLESVKLSKLAAEDRASHLDDAIKECMSQVRDLKEEHERELQEVVRSNTRQWEKVKQELEAKIANLDNELLRSAAENAALSRSLQERSGMIIKLNDEKQKAEARVEILKSDVESCEKEISSLKYEAHLMTKEFEIRNEEKNMSVKSAEAANKQHAEGMKKIAKLEAECQRLRGLVRKRLPGPAALAQMKLEVESISGSYGESRSKRSAGKSLSHPSQVPELSSDELLTQRMLAMEEEMKMLKEALATRNSELLTSRNLCAKVTNKLHILEAQLQSSSQVRSSPASSLPISAQGPFSHDVRSPPSLTSVSEDGNDDGRSCSESSATASTLEPSRPRKEKNPLELMDDFLEMEKLAGSAVESNGGAPNYSVMGCDLLENGGAVAADGISRYSGSADNGVDLVPQPLFANGDTGEEQVPLAKLRSRISDAFDSLSRENNVGKVLEDIKSAVEDAFISFHGQSLAAGQWTGAEQCMSSGTGIVLTSENCRQAIVTIPAMTADLTDAFKHVRDFIILLHKEALANHDLSAHSKALGQSIEDFLVTSQKVLDGDSTLVDFVQSLSCVLTMTSRLKFKVHGYRGTESEISSPDCVDKVALPENWVALSAASNNACQNGCSNISDTASNPEVPDYANMLVAGCGFHGSSCSVSLEDFENMKREKENLTLDLARCYEDMETLRSQLRDTEASLAQVKSQFVDARRSNTLAETQLKCMAESYRSLEARAEKLEAEISLLQDKTERLENELLEEKRGHRDTLDRYKDLEERLDRDKSCSNGVGVGHKYPQEKELKVAAQRLADCQETIFLLGKQLQALRPQGEPSAPPPATDVFRASRTAPLERPPPGS